MRAAFGGYLGTEMKSKAKQWADETPNIKKLPVKKYKKKTNKKSKGEAEYSSNGVTIRG